MGYITSYSLKICRKDQSNIGHNLAEEVIELLRKQDSPRYALTECGDIKNSCTWYDHEEDLIKFSKYHPDLLFTLSGEGEEAGDIWKKYFINGKVQVEKAQITIKEFNPKYFKDV